MTTPAHDVIGVGIGPFNLGLAALLHGVDDVDALLVDRKPQFAWHHGLMLDEAEVQVPFLADLVSLVDPTNPHSFLAYLADQGRLYRFYFHERLRVTRREFDAYYRWAAERLEACRFGAEVTAVQRDGDRWRVQIDGVDHGARAVVLGVGSEPAVPEFARALLGGHTVSHTADYRANRDALHGLRRVAVIGSGQSAAEVVADLLDHAPGVRVDWFTRSAGFLPMEHSKLGLEHFAPEYTAHFHGLTGERRDALRAGQDLLYKGISTDTSERIFDALYARTIDGGDAGITYAARSELFALDRAGDELRLQLRHLDTGERFTVGVDAVVLGTGQQAGATPFVDLEQIAQLDDQGRPVIDDRWRVVGTDGRPTTLFVQNAELHTHGVGAPDLGLGAHRNATIINELTGRIVYPLRDVNVFQTFGAPRA